MNCPKCGETLKRVEQPSEGPYSMLNADQWRSTIAGDLFCTCHNNNRGNKPYAYFWKHEERHKGSATAQTPEQVKDVCHVCGTKASYGYLGRYCAKCNVSRPIESATPVETPTQAWDEEHVERLARFIAQKESRNCKTLDEALHHQSKWQRIVPEAREMLEAAFHDR